MAVKIVDASAVGAMLFGEPQGQRITARLRESRLMAPALLSFEVASICVKKFKRYPGQRHALLESLQLFRRLAIEQLEVDISGVVRLAEMTKLTAYDASYLWLAQKLGAELVTLDRALSDATKSCV